MGIDRRTGKSTLTAKAHRARPVTLLTARGVPALPIRRLQFPPQQIVTKPGHRPTRLSVGNEESTEGQLHAYGSVCRGRPDRYSPRGGSWRMKSLACLIMSGNCEAVKTPVRKCLQLVS